MITSALIYLASLVIAFVLLLMTPLQGSSGFPAGVDSAVITIAGYTSYINTFVPLSVLKICIAFIITFELTILFFKIIRWLFSFMPFVGGK